MKVYKDLDRIPRGQSDDSVTQGCLVLEGGAWRGIYTEGVLDALLQENINMQTVIGVSAGAMNGHSYMAGQIGRTARVNLHYRHDPDYVGVGAFKENHGITGFSYLFDELANQEPLDMERFNDPRRRFIAVAASLETGEAVYFERGKCSDIQKAVQASATVPYISEPVMIDGKPYLDGGCAVKIPLDWALEEGFEKIVIIRTRERGFRKEPRAPLALQKRLYGNYPEFVADLQEEVPHYNLLLERIEQMQDDGRIFVISPSEPIRIKRFEGDMDKLGELYWLGYKDGKESLEGLKAYLGI